MSTELPASEHAGRDRHQLRTLILGVAILSTVMLAVFLGVTTATWLNQYGFLHFPLGFYLLAQGLLIFIVVATFWFIRLQERIDQARSVPVDSRPIIYGGARQSGRPEVRSAAVPIRQRHCKLSWPGSPC